MTKESKVGEALRAWRERKGWTQKRAAEEMKVSERTWQNWEQGHRTPAALEVLERIIERGRKK